MNALEVIRQVEAHGGRLIVREGELKVRAPAPLPEVLLEALRVHTPTVLLALGGTLDQTVSGILHDPRPHLSPALRRLPDEQLLALVNWHIIAAWEKAVQRVSRP